MIAVPSLRGLSATLVLAAIGCHAVAGVDYEIAQASSGGAPPLGQTSATTGDATTSVASTTVATSASASASEASSSSSGPVAACVPSLFHVSFDEDEPTTAPLLKQGPGARVTDATRSGAGAWRVALTEGDTRGMLQWAYAEPGTEYWLGFSHRAEGPGIANGTRFTSVFCSQGASFDWAETQALDLEMRGATPNFPFAGTGEAASFIGATADSFDDLENVQEVAGTWSDWVLHFDVTAGDDGFIEVFHARPGQPAEKVYRSTGYLTHENCGGRDYFLRVGLSRWSTTPPQPPPPAQSAVIDEVRLLRVDQDEPASELDYLHTLDPDSGCDAVP